MIAGELNILAAVSWLDDLYVGTLVVGGGYLLISLLGINTEVQDTFNGLIELSRVETLDLLDRRL